MAVYVTVLALDLLFFCSSGNSGTFCILQVLLLQARPAAPGVSERHQGSRAPGAAGQELPQAEGILRALQQAVLRPGGEGLRMERRGEGEGVMMMGD